MTIITTRKQEGEKVSEKNNLNEEIFENEEAAVEESTVESEDSSKECKKSDKKDKKVLKAIEKQLADALKAADDAQKEREAVNDTYLRMMAEYDNFRKRVQKEKENLYTDGMSEAVEKLLPVLDNLDRAAAIEVTNDEAKAVLEGVNKVLDQAKEIFEKMGVTEIPAKGEKFDPELHNAVMHENDPDSDESIVTEVFMKGYKMGDKVIRYSMVKVVN